MLNAGHRRGAVAGRCVTRGEIVETEELPAYCAVALAGLGGLPDTLLTRSVVVRMKRRSPERRLSHTAAGSTRTRVTSYATGSPHGPLPARSVAAGPRCHQGLRTGTRTSGKRS